MRGIKVILHEKIENGRDPFGVPVFDEIVSEVDNVLVSPSGDNEIVNAMQLYGKHLVYTLGIPKGDKHNWENAEVEFFGRKFRTFGGIEEGQEELVPTPWHKKVKVEVNE